LPGVFQSVFTEPVHVRFDVISTGLVAVIMPHPPAAGNVFVTIYDPGVLADIFILPVEVLINTRPAVDENVPAIPPPLNVGEGLAAFPCFHPCLHYPLG
jgi:hypothetical protein